MRDLVATALVAAAALTTVTAPDGEAAPALCQGWTGYAGYTCADRR